MDPIVERVIIKLFSENNYLVPRVSPFGVIWGEKTLLDAGHVYTFRLGILYPLLVCDKEPLNRLACFFTTQRLHVMYVMNSFWVFYYFCDRMLWLFLFYDCKTSAGDLDADIVEIAIKPDPYSFVAQLGFQSMVHTRKKLSKFSK